MNGRAAAVLATLGGIALFYYGMEMTAPLLLAVLLFFLLDPIVTVAERLKIPRPVSSLLLVLVFLVGFVGIAVGVYRGTTKLTSNLPRYSHKIYDIVKTLESKTNSIVKDTQKMIPAVPVADDTQKVQVVASEENNLGTTLFRGMNSVFSVVANLLLIPILAVFFLLEKNYLRTNFQRSLGENFPLRRASDEIAEMVRAYFVGNLVVGFLTAVAFYILFCFLGLENRAMLALLAGFLNLVPIFGAIIGAILPAAQALVQFDHYSEMFMIFGASIFFHIVVNSVVIPKMIGARINVNASAATVGLVFWGWVWGGVGLLLAIPLMGLLRIALSTSPGTVAWSNLIAENAEFPLFRVRKKVPVAV